MKIEIDNIIANEIISDLRDAIIVSAMKGIIEDDTKHYHPEDVKYYEELQAAAKLVRSHFTAPGEVL